MRAFCILLLVLTGTVACQSGSSDGTSLVQSEARVINPEIARRIEAKRGEASDMNFPRLSEIPTDLPDKYEQTVINNFQDELLEQGLLLSRSVSTDQTKAGRIRGERVALWVDGRRQEMTVEQAALQLVQQLENDKAKAKALRARGIPRLGGLPPKDQR
ncbi:MAG: hypothetical protein MRY59_14165 [Aquisalinus sp.]|nr:hypothetical protein [Aquisalinus sp.]